jgi:hypothetical protein
MVYDWDGDGINELIVMNVGGVSDTPRVDIINKDREIIKSWNVLISDVPEQVTLPRADRLWIANCWMGIRWNQDTPPHLIFSMHRSDQERDWDGWCVLAETNLEGESFQRTYFKKEWWRTIEASPLGTGQSFWGSTHTPEGAPVLAIFKTGFPTGEWLPADTTSGIVIYRFPVDPMYRKYLARSYVRGINVDHIVGRDNAIGIGAENISDSINFVYRIAKNGEYRWPEYSITNWNKRLGYARNRSIELSMDRREHSEYMNHPQIWDGESWQPLDPLDALPDSAYTIYSLGPLP